MPYPVPHLARKRVPTKALAKVLVFCLLGLQSGCVSGSVKNLDIQEDLSMDLPQELSQEMRDRFEVKEANLSLEGPTDHLQTKSLEEGKGKLNTKAKSRRPRGGRLRVKGKTTTQKLAKEDMTAPVAPPTFSYPKRRSEKAPIWQGEKFVYALHYLGMPAGDFVLEVLPLKIVANRKAYHIRGTATSSSVLGLFFRMNDRVESFFDYEGYFSHRFHLVLDESKQKRDSLELYDSEKRQTYYWNRLHPSGGELKESKEFSPIDSFPQDSISILYYLRTIPLMSGSTVSFPAVSEGKTWDVDCQVLRREKVRSPWGEIQAIVVQPEMKREGVPKKSESYVWFADDERRIPLRMEAKVKVGTISAELKAVEMGHPPET